MMLIVHAQMKDNCCEDTKTTQSLLTHMANATVQCA